MLLVKVFGAILIILSTSVLAFALISKQRDKIKVCDDLLSFCDEMLLELSYSLKSITSILESSNSKYILQSNILSNEIIETPLSDRENEKISEFLFSLGKSDVNSQVKIINTFKDYLDSLRVMYIEKYKSKSKIYISLGVYSGIIISLVLI